MALNTRNDPFKFILLITFENIPIKFDGLNFLLFLSLQNFDEHSFCTPFFAQQYHKALCVQDYGSYGIQYRNLFLYRLKMREIYNCACFSAYAFMQNIF